jgi:hypothetical protein
MYMMSGKDSVGDASKKGQQGDLEDQGKKG